MVKQINGEIYLALCTDDIWPRMQQDTNHVIME